MLSLFFRNVLSFSDRRLPLQSSLENLADSYTRFFKKQNKAPCFKSKNNKVQSSTTKETNNNIAIVDSKIKLPKLGLVRFAKSPEAHADTQCVIQRWVDSSISKTVNAPRGYTVSQVEDVYQRLYKGGAKGGTVYVDGSRDSQVLTLEAEETTFEHEEEYVIEAQPKIVLMDTVHELETTNVSIGSELGDRCPVCRKGHVAELGGCNTCTSCGAQLKCGL